MDVTPRVMPPVELKILRILQHMSNLQTADQTFTAKDLGRGVIDTCSTGSISSTRTGTGTGIYRDLYSLPELYRYNTGRIQRMLISYPNTHPT